MIVKKSVQIGNYQLEFETGRFAKQADGAVMVRYADTMVLATVVSSKKPKEGADYFPLQVEFREKLSAAGKIPGGFLKREGRPSDKEILSARLIDRPIRPMFPDGYHCETQVVVTVFSSDQQNDADVLGACAASAALMISDAPFDGPISEVRVGRVNGQFVINPAFDELETSDMDLTVAGTETSIVMVEGEAREISEKDMLDALAFGHEAIKKICALQKELAKEIGKAKRTVVVRKHPQDLVNEVETLAAKRIREYSHTVLTKDQRGAAKDEIETAVLESLKEKFPESEDAIKEVLHDIEKREMREMILAEGKRLDGRGLKDVRPITIETAVLPRAHGSALFTRGETQSLTTVTLGTKDDEQITDGLIQEEPRRFMLHYNFPPFSVGEIGRLGTGRREIGHGNLAERALKNLIASDKDFPYTVRIVSDILESNGSSSMATVCAGSLALFDAGVPLKKACAGIAMGLVKEGDRTAVLSDILGDEDHLGDMDFKVAGTTDGITGFQMDIKIQGITLELMATALEQAKAGRLHKLEKMNAALAAPKQELSKYAPRFTTIRIPTDMIGAVIGPGGKVIRSIVADSGAESINIEDDGSIQIAATSQKASDRALELINAIVALPEVGQTYKATVKRIMDFGAFAEILPGKEGLIHISQLDTKRVAKVTDVVKVGDTFDVKLMEIDEKGRLNLSRKALMVPEKKEGAPDQQPK
ncbi:MAG: polyribonucleotide nucleotidyltransferase [Bacteroidetes bacterium]|nr:MAG: polyribonucleotide nucleotidyltransferase [Bacteroidota bacterium]